MRPGDFSPGNYAYSASGQPGLSSSFNEAGGFLPRKLWETLALVVRRI